MDAVAIRKLEALRRHRARKRGEDIPLRNIFWTKSECDRLIEAYERNIGKRQGWLASLAESMGREKANLVRKAKSLGCVTDRRRTGGKPKQLVIRFWKLSPEELHVKRSTAMKEWQSRLGHPRGMLGKAHTEEVRDRMSVAHLGKLRGPMPMAQRMKLSAIAVKRLGSNPESFSRKINRGLSGRRKDLGDQFFRSRYEANYARFLNFNKEKWEYEKKTFWFLKIKRGVRSYTPDFYLPEKGEFHEVKGWMDPKSLTKLKRMKKYHPDVRVIVIDSSWFKAANRQGLCRLIPGWECSHKRHNISKSEG